MNNEFSVTPWEVSGKVDYERLLKQFGSNLISNTIYGQLKNAHPVLRRGIYFSHRDFDLWLKDADFNKKVSILTGRGPSEKMHIGHLIPFLAAKSLQDIYNCPVYIPISEDEKFFVKPNLSIENAKKFADDNILDLIALGFKQGKTFFIKDFSYPKVYEYSSKIAKIINYSQVKAIFGLSGENNIGWSFYPAVQAFHILWPQFVLGKHRTLVPVGIDQDPFIRLTRDISSHSSIKLEKPAVIHSKFISGLKGTIKMSASENDQTNLIYLSDSPKEVELKIKKYAFSGGKDTVDEHRKIGGNPDIDVSYQYLRVIFENDDKKLKKIHDDYKSGKLLTSELKTLTIEKINAFLKNHQIKRKQAEKMVVKYMFKD